MSFINQLLTSLVSDLDLAEFSTSYVDQVMERHSALVFSLAYDLTGDEDAAVKVVEEVFVRLHQEREAFAGEPLKTLLHRFTYDSAIQHLVGAAPGRNPLI